jgi:hypothetical protein
MTPVTGVSYAMVASALVVTLWGAAPLVLSVIACGGPAALTMWGNQRR